MIIARFEADSYLSFTIPGRPLTYNSSPTKTKAGAPLKKPGKEARAKQQAWITSKSEYELLVKLAAKSAIGLRAGGWRCLDPHEGEGVYMVLTLCCLEGRAEKERRVPKGNIYANEDVLCTRLPAATQIAGFIAKALRGIVYENEKQIIGLLVVKKFSKNPRVEVFIGRPLTWEGMLRDIRNC